MIEGRVVDTEGRPVAEAWVVIHHHHDTIATTDENGGFVFDDLEEAPFSQEFTMHATDGRDASWPVTVDWQNERVRAPDLVLLPGVPAHVAVRWDDGAPADGVNLWSTTHEEGRKTDDDRNQILVHEGKTDEEGVWRFGPVPATVDRVFVEANHPDGPPIQEHREGRIDGPLEFTMRRGGPVRGRLVTSDGAPAAGYRVAPHAPGLVDRAVTTDADGRFEIPAADPRNPVIAVYVPEPEPPADMEDLDEEEILRWMMRTADSPSNPVLMKEVPPGDVGTIELPALGTLTVRIHDTTGSAALSGHVFWHLTTHHHSARGCEVDPSDGTVRIDNVPLGAKVRLEAWIDDRAFGEIHQAFGVPETTEKPVSLRMTGAGNVIVRLHPKGEPRKPLIVDQPRASFGP